MGFGFFLGGGRCCFCFVLKKFWLVWSFGLVGLWFDFKLSQESGGGEIASGLFFQYTYGKFHENKSINNR